MSRCVSATLLALSAVAVQVSAGGVAVRATPAEPYVNLGTTDAVAALLDRVLPGSKSHFTLQLAQTCLHAEAPCYSLEDDGDKIKVTATGAAELAAGIGFYFREHCNMVIGWPRGGGSNVFIPSAWPKVGSKPVVGKRNTPWSYMMNVCTHSYSLVWYSWEDWEHFIDWMALSGINLFLGMTGQEEVQYKVFQKFGLTDMDIRSWFNGPALLTWSRGQNEYGSHIGGPLPRSWMKQQWNMMKQITTRYRSLGMTSQLPAFQGNVPIQLKTLHHDSNMTDNHKDTGWINSVDPLYAKIADEWMKQIIADFGTDHWYQLDGYFNGGTAPWLSEQLDEADLARGAELAAARHAAQAGLVPKCEWGALTADTFSPCCTGPSCYAGCRTFNTVDAAKAACVAEKDCNAITSAGKKWELRSGQALKKSPNKAESSYLITNAKECGHTGPPGPQPPADLEGWYERGTAAYTGLNRTDPEAIWSFQGWAFVGWNSDQQRDSLKSFIDATPEGKFNVVDMSVNGEGEWKKWNNGTGLWGANDKGKYIWTTLHDFGGTDGLKGDLARINHIPFDGIDAKTNVWGTGFTPEGIDQNPVYYEFMLERNFASQPVADITDHIVRRSHRRYNLDKELPEVTDAWTLLVNSSYAQDLSVQDGTGVPHLGNAESWAFESDKHTPSSIMCKVYTAWSKLIDASASIKTAEPFRYDLVNTGREVLAQLAGPAGQNFTAAIGGEGPLDAAAIKKTGEFYADVLKDVDALVATDTAFQIGPWIEMAKAFANMNGTAGVEDCTEGVGADKWPTITSCVKFYEWNARTQLTTWNPTPKGGAIPGGPIDYASKHWSGLIRDYYAARVTLVMEQALKDAAAGKPLDNAAVSAVKAEHAYNWTTATNPYPTEVVGDYVAVSKAMRSKYMHFFAPCN